MAYLPGGPERLLASSAGSTRARPYVPAAMRTDYRYRSSSRFSKTFRTADA
jgi:hypothetical protein